MKVLQVDDDEAFLEQTKLFLKEEDERLEVETTTSPKKALKKLKNRQFDAVVSDYKMPEINGLKFLKKVRKENKEIPFVITTGKGDEDIAMEALNLGADRYLQKLEDPETLFPMLADTLIQVIKRKKTEERNKFLMSLIDRDLKSGIKNAKRHMESMKKIDLPPKGERRLKKAIESLVDSLSIIEDKEKAEKSEKEEETERKFVNILNRFLGYAHWSESNLESELWDVYREVGQKKESFIEVAKRSEKSKTLLEKIESKIDAINLKKTAESIEIREAGFGKKSGNKIFAEIMAKERFKKEVYEKLKSSADVSTLREIWQGENPKNFFKILNRLIKNQKKNYRILKKLETELFPGELPSVYPPKSSKIYRI